MLVLILLTDVGGCEAVDFRMWWMGWMKLGAVCVCVCVCGCAGGGECVVCSRVNGQGPNCICLPGGGNGRGKGGGNVSRRKVLIQHECGALLCVCRVE